VQPLERVLAVEHLALVHRAEVALDVGPGERRAAEQHRHGRQARVFSSSRFSRMMSVLLTSRPLMPMASASTSRALATMSAMLTLMPRLKTS
jgi:hypothetical protein